MGRFGVTEIPSYTSSCFITFGGKKIPELMKGLGSGIKRIQNAAKDDQPTNSKKRRRDKRINFSKIKSKTLIKIKEVWIFFVTNDLVF